MFVKTTFITYNLLQISILVNGRKGTQMKFLITGGTGLIGQALTEKLLSQGNQVTILSRSKDKVTSLFADRVQAIIGFNEITAHSRFDIVINLAGAPIIDKRWSAKRKLEISNSRIKFTAQLVDAISNMQHQPDVLISGSAIGFYGSQGDTALHESSPAIDDFAHHLCNDWEQAALQAETLGVRVCIIRTGLVLASEGGMLAPMLTPFKLCLGGRLGNGQQWMSWIDLDDWIKIALTMVNNSEMHGVYNATAPDPVRNKVFTRSLAKHLHRPAFIPIPALLLKLALGERSELILGSQNVLPFKLMEHGFKFDYPDLDRCLKHCLSTTD